jgi:hypothetical protein
VLRSLEPVRRPHSLPENQDFEHMWLPEHSGSLSGVLEAGSKKWLRAI